MKVRLGGGRGEGKGEGEERREEKGKVIKGNRKQGGGREEKEEKEAYPSARGHISDKDKDSTDRCKAKIKIRITAEELRQIQIGNSAKNAIKTTAVTRHGGIETLERRRK